MNLSLNRNRTGVIFLLLSLFLFLFFIIDIITGSTTIEIREIFLSLTGKGDPQNGVILMQFRLPKALTSVLAGAAMSVSGLLMQTLFRNPLAGPDVMGVSSGAGLGVAVMILSFTPAINIASGTAFHEWTIIFAAWAGAGMVMLIIMTLSSRVRDIMTVLIAGILIASAISAIVSLLQYFSNETMLKTYVIWTMGNLGNLSPDQIRVLLIATIIGILLALAQVKSLNAMLMGEMFSRSVGVSIRRTRLILFASASILTGSVTAFCGPLAFIGIAVPHLARMTFGTSDHRVLLPGVILSGAIVVLLSDIVSALPGGGHVIPVNTVTSLIGIPVVLWIILNRPATGHTI